MFRNSLRPTLIGFATPTLLGVTYASAAGPYEITVARWRDAARRYLSSKCLRKIPRPAAADAFDKTGSISFGVKAAQRGYVAVIQGVRGRFRSEGDRSLKHESQDGYDAIEGAAALPQSNGKIGMFCGSCVGATQIPYCDRLAASAGHLPGGDGVELSRRLDVSERGVRAVARRIVDDGTGDEHNAAPRGIERQPAASGRTFCRSHPIPALEALGGEGTTPYFKNGWRIRITTSTGSSGQSKSITSRFAYQYFRSSLGTAFFLADCCGIIYG